jgi:hypothetical protein
VFRIAKLSLFIRNATYLLYFYISLTKRKKHGDS